PPGGFTQVPSPRHAITTSAAYYVSLAADQVAHMEIVDIRANLFYRADKLVSDHHRHGDRLLGPSVPIVDMHVGTTDARLEDADQDIVDADRGARYICQPQSGFSLVFDECFHD